MDGAGAVTMRRVHTLLAGVVALVPLVASGHHLAAPKVDLVSVSKNEIRIAVDYSLDPAQSGTLRGLYDRNRDGRIADAESKPAEAWLRLAATSFLTVRVDGKDVRLSELAVELRGMDGRGDLGGMFVLSAPLSLASGEHRLELRDRHKDAATGVPVRITFARGLDSEAPDTPFVLDAQIPSLAIDFRAQ
jgi:ABC-type uncharacterized transport system substrate-binding protein